MVTRRLLLIIDGDRNARLYDARNECSACGLTRNATRGENTAPSMELNLSTRAPTDSRYMSLKKISSCTYPPPSVRESSPGAIVRSNALYRTLPPKVTACFVPIVFVSPYSTSKVL